MSAKNQTKDTDGELPYHLDIKFTVAEAAKELKVTTKTIRNWIKERKLGCRRIGIGRGRIVITGSQIDAIADERIISRLSYLLFGDSADARELDPAYEPPTPTEVNLDDLTDEQLNAAILIPFADRPKTSVVTSTDDQDFDADQAKWFWDFMNGKTDE